MNLHSDLNQENFWNTCNVFKQNSEEHDKLLKMKYFKISGPDFFIEKT